MVEETQPKKKTSKTFAYISGIGGVILTVIMAVAVIYYGDWFQDELASFGYLGAFIISVLGGATIVVPVPMLAVVFALGGVMKFTWAVGLAAALGEVVGAFIIYMTGIGGGHVMYNSKYAKVQAFYDRLMILMEKRGSLTLFLVSAVINPFFYPAALAAGAMHFSIKKYFIVCLLGKTIKNMMIVYAGYWGIKGIFHALGLNI